MAVYNVEKLVLPLTFSFLRYRATKSFISFLVFPTVSVIPGVPRASSHAARILSSTSPASALYSPVIDVFEGPKADAARGVRVRAASPASTARRATGAAIRSGARSGGARGRARCARAGSAVGAANAAVIADAWLGIDGAARWGRRGRGACKGSARCFGHGFVVGRGFGMTEIAWCCPERANEWYGGGF